MVPVIVAVALYVDETSGWHRQHDGQGTGQLATSGTGRVGDSASRIVSYRFDRPFDRPSELPTSTVCPCPNNIFLVS